MANSLDSRKEDLLPAAAILPAEDGWPAAKPSPLLGLFSIGKYPTLGRKVLSLANFRDRRSFLRALRGEVPPDLLETMYSDSGLRSSGPATASHPELTALVLRTAAPDDGLGELLPLGLRHHTEGEVLAATDADLAGILAAMKAKKKPLGPYLVDLGDDYDHLGQFTGESCLPLPAAGGKLVACLSPEYRDTTNPLDDSMTRVTVLAGPGGPPIWVAEEGPEEMEGGAIGLPFADEGRGLYLTAWQDLCIHGFFDLSARGPDGDLLASQFVNLAVLFLNRPGRPNIPWHFAGGVLFGAAASQDDVVLSSWDPRGEEADEEDPDDYGTKYVEVEFTAPFQDSDLVAVDAAPLGQDRFAVATFAQQAGTRVLAVLVHLVDRRRRTAEEVKSFRLDGCTYRAGNSGSFHFIDRFFDCGYQTLAFSLSCLDLRTVRTPHRSLGRSGRASDLFAAQQASPTANTPLKP